MRLTVFRLALGIVFMLAATLSALDRVEPSDIFLDLYQSYRAGERLEAAGDLNGALQSFRVVLDRLNLLETDSPSWNPAVVGFRRHRVEQAIDQVTQMIVKAGGTVPKPQPILPFDPRARSLQGNAGNRSVTEGEITTLSGKLDTDTLPAISLQEAIKIAEKYIAEKHIDVDDRFLKAAKFENSGPWTKGTYIGKGNYWLLSWDRYHLKGTGDVITFVVYVDGKVGHFNTM